MTIIFHPDMLVQTRIRETNCTVDLEHGTLAIYSLMLVSVLAGAIVTSKLVLHYCKVGPTLNDLIVA